MSARKKTPKGKKAPKSAKPAQKAVQKEPLHHKTVLAGVSALLKHHQRTQAAKPRTALFDDDTPLNLIVSLRHVPPPRIRPYQIPLTHSLYDGAEVCVFTKDTQKEFRELFARQNVQNVSKVIGLTKLKKNHREYEAKRQLCDSYDVFLADDRILPFLPRLLGKKFFKTKKIPFAVNLRNPKKINDEVQKALQCTSLVLAGGTTIQLKVGNCSMSARDNSMNLVTAVRGAVEHLGGWSNVRAMYVKTPSSVSVPVFEATALPRDVAKALRDELANKRNTSLPTKTPADAKYPVLDQFGVEWSGDESSDDDDDENVNDDDDDEQDNDQQQRRQRRNDPDGSSDEEADDNDDDDDDDDDDDELDQKIDTTRRERASKKSVLSADRLRAKAAKQKKRPASEAASATPPNKKARKNKRKAK